MSEPISVEALELNVKTSAGTAADSIDQLIRKLGELKKGLEENFEVNFGASISRSVSNSVKGLQTGVSKGFEQAAKGIQRNIEHLTKAQANELAKSIRQAYGLGGRGGLSIASLSKSLHGISSNISKQNGPSDAAVRDLRDLSDQIVALAHPSIAGESDTIDDIRKQIQTLRLTTTDIEDLKYHGMRVKDLRSMLSPMGIGVSKDKGTTIQDAISTVFGTHGVESANARMASIFGADTKNPTAYDVAELLQKSWAGRNDAFRAEREAGGISASDSVFQELLGKITEVIAKSNTLSQSMKDGLSESETESKNLGSALKVPENELERLVMKATALKEQLKKAAETGNALKVANLTKQIEKTESDILKASEQYSFEHDRPAITISGGRDGVSEEEYNKLSAQNDEAEEYKEQLEEIIDKNEQLNAQSEAVRAQQEKTFYEGKSYSMEYTNELAESVTELQRMKGELSLLQKEFNAIYSKSGWSKSAIQKSRDIEKLQKKITKAENLQNAPKVTTAEAGMFAETHNQLDLLKAKAIEAREALASIMSDPSASWSDKFGAVMDVRKADAGVEQYKELQALLANVSPEIQNTAQHMLDMGVSASTVRNRLFDLDGELKQKPKDTKKASSGFKEFSKTLKSGKHAVSDYIKNHTKLLHQFGRVAKMRAMRAVIRGITSALKEGINNLYQWSKANNGSFAKSMDSATTSLLYMKNSIATAISPAIEALVPILEKVTDWVVQACNWLSQFFALLNGQNSWTKAVKKNKEYADSAKNAADSTKEMLASFDELNVITSESNGSSNKKNTDYSGMFTKETEFDSSIMPWVEKAKEALGWIKQTAKDIWDIVSPAIQKLAPVIKEAITKLMPIFKQAVETLTPIVEKLINKAVDFAVKVWPTIKKALEFIGNNLDWILPLTVSLKLLVELATKLSNIKNLFGGGGGTPTINPTTPTVNPTIPKTKSTTPSTNDNAGSGFWDKTKNFVSGAGKLGLTGAVALAPAWISYIVSKAIPDKDKIFKKERVTSANYTSDELSKLREWTTIQNEIASLDYKFGTDEFDGKRYEELNARLGKLGDVQNGELWNKYWDYLVANDIRPGFDQLPIKMLDEMAGITSNKYAEPPHQTIDRGGEDSHGNISGLLSQNYGKDGSRQSFLSNQYIASLKVNQSELESVLSKYTATLKKTGVDAKEILDNIDLVMPLIEKEGFDESAKQIVSLISVYGDDWINHLDKVGISAEETLKAQTKRYTALGKKVPESLAKGVASEPAYKNALEAMLDTTGLSLGQIKKIVNNTKLTAPVIETYGYEKSIDIITRIADQCGGDTEKILSGWKFIAPTVQKNGLEKSLTAIERIVKASGVDLEMLVNNWDMVAPTIDKYGLDQSIKIIEQACTAAGKNANIIVKNWDLVAPYIDEDNIDSSVKEISALIDRYGRDWKKHLNELELKTNSVTLGKDNVTTPLERLLASVKAKVDAFKSSIKIGVETKPNWFDNIKNTIQSKLDSEKDAFKAVVNVVSSVSTSTSTPTNTGASSNPPLTVPTSSGSNSVSKKLDNNAMIEPMLPIGSSDSSSSSSSSGASNSLYSKLISWQNGFSRLKIKDSPATYMESGFKLKVNNQNGKKVKLFNLDNIDLVAAALKKEGFTVDEKHAKYGQGIHQITLHKKGGYDIPHGSLFIANEGGSPELVGRIGDRTTVANNDQIIRGIAAGISAVMAPIERRLERIERYAGITAEREPTVKLTPSVALGRVNAQSALMYGKVTGR